MSCLQALLHAVVQRQGVSPGGSNSLLDLDTLELAVALEAAAETEGGGCGGCDGSLSPGDHAEVRLGLDRGQSAWLSLAVGWSGGLLLFATQFLVLLLYYCDNRLLKCMFHVIFYLYILFGMERLLFLTIVAYNNL